MHNGQKELTLDVEVRLRSQNYGENLAISEHVEIDQLDFLEICKILGVFHDLTSKIKKEHEKHE